MKTTYNDDGGRDGLPRQYHQSERLSRLCQALFGRLPQQFAGKQPREALSHILSDPLHLPIDESGIHYVASLMIPDSMSSFEVMVTVGSDGQHEHARFLTVAHMVLPVALWPRTSLFGILHFFVLRRKRFTLIGVMSLRLPF